MPKSHAAGWASDAPTPAQLKEFFAQIESGRITKVRLQSFLRNETSTVREVKGHGAFMAFLNQELDALGLSHWYAGDEYAISTHHITIPKYRNSVLEFFIGPAGQTIALIQAEPDSPSSEIESDAFRIRVLDARMRPKLQ